MTFKSKLKASAFGSFFVVTVAVMVAFTNCGRAVLGGLDSSSNSADNTQSVAVGTSSCPTGQIAIGLASAGSVICAPLINTSGSICPTGSSVYLTSSSAITCVTNTSWDQSGTGTMCTTGSYLISYSTAGAIQCGMPTTTLANLSAQCPTGYYLNGIVNGQPSCLALPASTPSAVVCPTNYYLNNITNSVPDCETRIWAAPTTTAVCPAGQFALGWAAGKLVCRQTNFNAANATVACAPGLVMTDFVSGAAVCGAAPNPDLSLACRSGFHVSSISQGIVVCEASVTGSTECASPGQFVTGLVNGTPVCSAVASNSLPGACPRGTYPMGISNGALVCAGFDNTRYASTSLVCAPGDVKLCALTGGIGHQTCSSAGDGYSTCLADSCSAGYQAQNGVCQPLTCQPGSSQNCNLLHGTGQQACNVQGSWGTCQPQTCDTGYFLNNGACAPVTCAPGATLSCSAGPAFGARTCAVDGSGYGDCTITSCQNGYTLQGSTCVDTSAPRITITAPANPSSGNSLTIVYAAIDNESGVAGVSCSLDGVKLTSCASPVTLTGLTSGTHIFKVIAKDTTGNSATGSVSWTQQVCDAGTAKVCKIPNGAGAQSCQADGNYAANCGPVTCESGYQVLNNACVSLTCGEGFSAVGNACVDNVSPTIQITAKPSDPLIAGHAQVEFTATDAGSGVASILCSLDGGTAAACQNPVSLGSLSAGAHSLVIQAIDHANNVAKVEVVWHQYTCAPGTRVSCGIANGAGAQTCAADGSSYGSCQVTSCSSGYSQQGAQCVYVPKACTGPDGKAIGNGQSATYFAAAKVGVGASCQSETRSCSDGTLSGSYTNASCVAQTATKVPLHRFFSTYTGEHFYTANYWEGTLNYWYRYEGIGFNVIAENVAGSAPLYRCWTGQMHFVSRDANCENHAGKNEGTYGYVYTDASSGGKALERYFQQTKYGDHLITTNPAGEFIYQNFYRYEGVLGYVP